MTEVPMLSAFSILQMRSYLQKFDDQIQENALIRFAMQLCSSLKYLESQRFVHRDIAARNCLVFDHDLMKLADFGLSRLLDDETFYYKCW